MTDDAHRTRRGQVAPPDLRERAAALIAREGPTRAARQLGIRRESLISLAAGIPVLPGTIALFRERSEAA